MCYLLVIFPIAISGKKKHSKKKWDEHYFLNQFAYMTTKKVGIIPNETDKIKHSIAGAVAGCVSSIITCPLDVVKTRLQNQGKIVDHRVPIYQGTGGIYFKTFFSKNSFF